MSDVEGKLREVLKSVERVRKALSSTQAHAADYVWMQIGTAVTDLKKVEKELAGTIRSARDIGD